MNQPVIPIPPSYYKDESLDCDRIIAYCKYLIACGASRLMTTAGTSQFNLLTLTEIHDFNMSISKLPCEKILGVPALSLRHTLEFIKFANRNYHNRNTSLLLLFPDRFYRHENIAEFFYTCADMSDFSCYIHGMPMRRGNGGMFDFDSKLINLLSLHKNISGMKEEHSSLAQSYKEISNITDPNFEIIVAGGSMRRFLFLENAGAHTFLSGVGNINPQIELDFTSYINEGNHLKCSKIVSEFENECFKKFMSIGWHKSLRTALRLKGLCCDYNRLPFTSLNIEDEFAIIDVVALLEKYNDNK